MILSCSGLTKSYSGKEVLKNITFHIEEHDKLAIVGVNGADKSILLRILVSLILIRVFMKHWKNLLKI